VTRNLRARRGRQSGSHLPAPDIFDETTKAYPELVADEVSIQRVRVLIAHSILTNDAPLKPNKRDEENDIILDLDKTIKIQE
jgi:hypothetical protein